MQARIQGIPEADKSPDPTAVQGPILPEAFEKLFRDHYDLVFRTAFRITGNAMDAEDALQTVFLRLLRRERAPDLKDGEQSYFHQAAINAAIDTVRRRRHHIRPDDTWLHSLPDPHPGPDQSDSVRELREWLRAAIADLHPKTAQIFVLRYLEGYSNPEIARRLGTSQATVAVLLYRARRRLQKSIRSFLGGAS